MKKTLIGMFAITCMMLAFTTTVSAQKKIAVKLQSSAVESNRSASKIKGEAPTTDVVETKSRGTCSVFFDNYSGLYVKVYVDGYYRGTLSPYGSFTVNVADGYTEIYCISTGGTRDWTATGNCTGRYTYSLY
ncbi:hypothetical protein CAP36_04945 [Chitinophagaceae bacterium IBVUCB2]|nr:hypothetical protein CAP36_04945 [Chitinophagaceae bacterium IBVUCB2]